MRPARAYISPTALSDFIVPAGTYVAHVIGQFAAREAINPLAAARSYEAADTLGLELPSRTAATL